MPSRITRCTRTPLRLVNALCFSYCAPLGIELKSVSLLRQHLKSDPTEPPDTPREDPEGGGDEEAGGGGEGEGQKLARPTSASSSRLKPKLPPLEKPADD